MSLYSKTIASMAAIAVVFGTSSAIASAQEAIITDQNFNISDTTEGLITQKTDISMEQSMLLGQLSNQRLSRQSITPTRNPDALDAKYEDNDYLDTAYEWGYYSNGRTLSGVIDKKNKKIEDGYDRGYDFDFYRVTVTPSSGVQGMVAFQMSTPNNKKDYDLYLYREDSPTSFTLVDYSDNAAGVQETVRTMPISQNTTYVIGVIPKTDADANDPDSPTYYPLNYSLTQVNNITKGSYTGNFSPSTMTCPANGTSNTVSLNLQNVSSIPNRSSVKSVEITGNFKPSISISTGNYLLMNGTEGQLYTAEFYTRKANASFKDLKERIDLPAKTTWLAAYTYSSVQTSTISNAQLKIQYYYDWTA